MEKTSRKQIFIIGLFLLLIGCTMFFYWAKQKEVWFCDEIYTYESANGFEQSWPATNLDTWMSGSDVEKFFSADADKLLLRSISDHLYSDHVPLYFWLFRIVSFFFFRGSGSIWIGLSMNLVMYVALLLIVYKVFLYLVKSPALSGIATISTCVVNRLMTEQALTLRMYLMLVWVELLLLISSFYVIHRVNSKKKLSAVSYIALFVVSLTGFLTHYDFWLFYAATAATCCMYLLILAWKKQKKNCWKTIEFGAVVAWVGNFIATLGSTVLLFPYCRWNLNRDKGGTALHSILDFSPVKIRRIIWGYKRFSVTLFGDKMPVVLGLLILFGCIVGGMIVLWKQKEKVKFTWLLLTFLIAQEYQFVVCFTMPALDEERYLWGSFSILGMCAFWGAVLLLQTGFAKIKEEKIRRIAGPVLAVVLVFGFLGLQWFVMDGGDGIAYLNYPGKDVKQLEAHKSSPWLVYGPIGGVYSYYDWLIPEKICFVSSDNTSEDTVAIQALANEGEIVLYAMKEYYPMAVEFMEKELGRKLQGEYLFDSTSLSVYVLK